MIQMQNKSGGGRQLRRPPRHVHQVLGGAKRRDASVGDKIVVSVKEAIPRGRVKKGDVLQAIVVRISKAIKRKDGSAIRFDKTRP